MVNHLQWKEGEGYDIYVLRGVDDQHRAPESKALDKNFEIDPNFPLAQFPLEFVARFKGAPNAHGVKVDTATGVVIATASPAQPKLRNFLITARQDVGGGNTNETIIRIHVHDSIQKIWLTPSTLTVRRGSDEQRFTVLALFDDGVVGDITEWPQLTYRSSNATVVSVANTGDPDPLSSQPVALGGGFTVNTPGGNSVITVNLSLTTPPTNLSATATVFARTFWSEEGKKAKVRFVAGPIAPIPNDVEPTSVTNVQSVLSKAANVLFIAEGFRKEQKRDFDEMVTIIVKALRNKDYCFPFKLLRDSINYWSVFVESHEEAISILGDQQINVMQIKVEAFPIPLPRKPTPTSAQWTVENMIHEGGLPVPLEASALDPAAWVASRAKIYDIPGSASATPKITQKVLDAWNGLKSRSLLNERNTAFGLAHYNRPRASGQDQSEWRLMLDGRRTSEASLQRFITSLTFGKDPHTSDPIEIGKNWLWDSESPQDLGQDIGLVCILCRDDTRGGTWAPTGRRMPYFAANAGQNVRARVTVTANGQDINSPIGKLFSAPMLASRVARGCGHALGLGDEYGDDQSVSPGTGRIFMGPNIQPEDANIVTTSPGTAPRVIDATKIKWLWPRIIKASVVDVQFDSNGNLESPEKCDPSGTPNPNGSHLLVRLGSPIRIPFLQSDMVRMRALGRLGRGRDFWIPSSEDQFAAFALFVEKTLTDTEIILGYQNPSPPQLGYQNPSGTQLDLAFFSPLAKFSLIAPRIEAGNESQLVADPIRMHIDTSDSPLNAPRGSKGAVCVPGSPAFDLVTPTNLPQGLRSSLRYLSDIVGIYDGGDRVDCGCFRPTGRCKMRSGFDTTIPFCYVCCYIIVDMLDPTMHEKLDIFYPEVSP
jgi:hypothetical protein